MSVVLHISRNIHHIILIYGTHVENDNIYKNFFHFFKILIFWFVRGVKEQKIVQNDKKFCLWRSISQEPYIIWSSSFVLCKCKMITFSGLFSIFSKFWFFRLLRRLKDKKWPKMTKKLGLSVVPYISTTIHHIIFFYGARV